ncbi:biotin/lipoyl-containing protein [Salipiger sp.]|uniref:biotin/lipoyl-containing protein n=1 Tax=Salipiger sp. TaxID=2078585 RepID=UPI003A96A195
MSDRRPWRPAPEELDALRDALIRAGGASLELEIGDVRICMVPATTRSAPHATIPAAPEAEPPAPTIDSDGPGIFRAADPAGGGALAAPGTEVSPGQIVGLLQAGAALWPVTSTRAGRIEAVLVADGEIVGYGTPLYRLSR